MNQIIYNQLKKVSSVDIEFNNNSTKIFIPRTSEIKSRSMKVGQVYTIDLNGVQCLVEVQSITNDTVNLVGVELKNPTEQVFGEFNLNDVTVLRKEI